MKEIHSKNLSVSIFFLFGDSEEKTVISFLSIPHNFHFMHSPSGIIQSLNVYICICTLWMNEQSGLQCDYAGVKHQVHCRRTQNEIPVLIFYNERNERILTEKICIHMIWSNLLNEFFYIVSFPSFHFHTPYQTIKSSESRFIHTNIIHPSIPLW